MQRCAGTHTPMQTHIHTHARSLGVSLIHKRTHAESADDGSQASQESLRAVQEATSELASLEEKIAGTQQALEECDSVAKQYTIDQQTVETREDLVSRFSQEPVDDEPEDDQEAAEVSNKALRAKVSIEDQLEALAPIVGKYIRYLGTDDYDEHAYKNSERTTEELKACIKARRLIARVRH